MNSETKTTASDGNRVCTRCQGSGRRHTKGFTALNGDVYPDRTEKCYSCDGKGEFAPLDIPALIGAIKGRNGLRSKRPDSDRAYYVWRMARFHGGADVTMPVCAMTDIDGDPFRPDLDRLADAVAKAAFGNHIAAACRWAPLLGISLDGVAIPRGLPATAYPSGPACLVPKPEVESLELV